MHSFIGKISAARAAITRVRIMIFIPSEMPERNGILQKAKLAAKEISTIRAMTLFFFFFFFFNAKNIPYSETV